MSDNYNLGAIRDLLIVAFDPEELKELFYFSENPDLREVVNQFVIPGDSLPAMVRKAVRYCESRLLLAELLAEVEQRNPRQYARFEPHLFVREPRGLREEETASPAPEIVTISSPIYLDLVRVAEGPFLMGSVAARDQHAQDDELPPHRVYTPEFYIGQYPVTNLQYQAFISASQHEAPQYWDAGEVPGATENHPVVWISWEDALAFCAWLSDRTGQVFRLPTEAEWEKAARGPDGFIYPWGDELPDESRCNFGGKIGETTPIGLYSPQGDSPYGCADMLGNAWEWCQSLYRPYPYRADDGREDTQAEGIRVLRGGAFYFIQRNVRCAYRNRILPHDAYRSFGFRVVAPNPVT